VDSRGPRILLACGFVFFVVDTPASNISMTLVSNPTRHVPGDNFLCTSFLQFPDWSWELWGLHKFCKFNCKDVPRQSSMYFPTFCKAYVTHYSMTACICDRSGNIWLWTIGVSLSDYLLNILCW
jgi:hypothetical protein